jgi:hypothetical protein
MTEQQGDYVVPDGTPCIDMACAATTTEGCRYPLWTMCGHPVERPARSAKEVEYDCPHGHRAPVNCSLCMGVDG